MILLMMYTDEPPSDSWQMANIAKLNLETKHANTYQRVNGDMTQTYKILTDK